MVKEIAIGLLVPHLESCNYMPKEALLKLRRNIEFAGSYEPLVVRPHAQESGKFQVIHGHNRLRVLKAMGHTVVQCVQWDLDDEQTRVYLAVMNRGSGSDIMERRSMLLEQLLQQMTIDDLAALVPDKKRVLEELQELSKLEIDDLMPESAHQADEYSAPVIINCMMEATGAKSVDLALDMIIEKNGGQLSRGKAMVELAKRFLRHCTASEYIPDENDDRSAIDGSTQGMKFVPPTVQSSDSVTLPSVNSNTTRTPKRHPLRVRAR